MLSWITKPPITCVRTLGFIIALGSPFSFLLLLCSKLLLGDDATEQVEVCVTVALITVGTDPFSTLEVVVVLTQDAVVIDDDAVIDIGVDACEVGTDAAGTDDAMLPSPDDLRFSAGFDGSKNVKTISFIVIRKRFHLFMVCLIFSQSHQSNRFYIKMNSY